MSNDRAAYKAVVASDALLKQVAENLHPEDLEEVSAWGLGEITQELIAEQFYRAKYIRVVTRNGEPIAVLGITLWEQYAFPWVIRSNFQFSNYEKRLLIASGRKVVEIAKNLHPVLYVSKWAGSPNHLTFLKHLGFSILPARLDPRNGNYFHDCIIVRNS